MNTLLNCLAAAGGFASGSGAGPSRASGPSGPFYGFEVIWRGLAYSAVDALILSTFPAVLADLTLPGNRKGVARKAAFTEGSVREPSAGVLLGGCGGLTISPGRIPWGARAGGWTGGGVMAHEVVVVVGVGGMGEAVARRQGPGRQVLLADVNTETLGRVASALRGEGYAVTELPVDVSDHASVRALADAAAELGPVTQLVHTAGLSPVQASVEAILRVDLAGVAYALEEFGRVIAPEGAGVVIASMAGAMAMGRFPAELEAALALTAADELLSLPFLQPGVVPDAGAAYGLAKRGNQVRVQAASLIWAVREARVNSISPGIIATSMGQQELAGESGAMMRAMLGASASKRLGTAADIAAATAFLLGPESAFITGTDVLVDGGVVAAVRSGALTLPSGPTP